MSWTDPAALAAWATPLATVVLVGVTWYYVRLTRDLVRQNQETVERERKREEVRRRQAAVELTARVAEKRVLFIGNNMPKDLGADGVRERLGVLHGLHRLALDVGDPDLARRVVAAQDAVRGWLREGRDAERGAGGDPGLALAHMHDAMEHMTEAAERAEAIARGAEEEAASG